MNTHKKLAILLFASKKLNNSTLNQALFWSKFWVSTLAHTTRRAEGGGQVEDVVLGSDGAGGSEIVVAVGAIAAPLLL